MTLVLQNDSGEYDKTATKSYKNHEELEESKQSKYSDVSHCENFVS